MPKKRAFPKDFVPPRWCDLNCPQAEWPKETALDGAGSCRTFVAVHCKLLDQIVAKNGPCQVPRRGGR